MYICVNNKRGNTMDKKPTITPTKLSDKEKNGFVKMYNNSLRLELVSWHHIEMMEFIKTKLREWVSTISLPTQYIRCLNTMYDSLTDFEKLLICKDETSNDKFVINTQGHIPMQKYVSSLMTIMGEYRYDDRFRFYHNYQTVYLAQVVEDCFDTVVL